MILDTNYLVSESLFSRMRFIVKIYVRFAYILLWPKVTIESLLKRYRAILFVSEKRCLQLNCGTKLMLKNVWRMVTYHFHSSPLLTMITIIVSRISPASVDVNTQYNRPFTTVARHITNMACMMKRSRVKIALKMLHFEAIASRKQSEVTLKDPPSSGQIARDCLHL